MRGHLIILQGIFTSQSHNETFITTVDQVKELQQLFQAKAAVSVWAQQANYSGVTVRCYSERANLDGLNAQTIPMRRITGSRQNAEH